MDRTTLEALVTDFSPWAEGGKATRDGRTITGTLALRADSGLRMTSVEIVDGVILVVVFELDDPQ